MAANDFPRPNLNSIVAAVTGNNMRRTGLRIPALEVDPRLNFVRGAYLNAQLIDRMSMAFTSFKAPLTTALNTVIIPSIEANFAEQGRPPWKKLTKKTIYNRQMEGYQRGPILQKTGRLKREATRKNIWTIEENILKLRTNYFDQKVPYARFHQLGAQFESPGQTVKKTVQHIRTQVGSPPGSFVTSERSFNTLGGDSKLPARPFMQLTDTEVIHIYGIFVAFMEEKVEKYWKPGSDGL